MGFFFFSLYATSKAYGSSQTRDWLQPSAAIHTAAVAAPDPLIHCARQGSICASAITLVAVVGFFTHCSLVGTLSMAISRLSTLSIQKQNIFPFFESLSIPFINVLWFSAYNSFTFLVRYIPKYFMFFNAIFKGIFFKLSLSDLLLLMWRNAVDFFMLVLHPATLLNSLFSSSGFYVQSVGFTISLSLSLYKYIYSTMSSAYSDDFTSSLPIWILLISFSYLVRVGTYFPSPPDFSFHQFRNHPGRAYGPPWLFCSIDSCVCFCSNTTLFWLL